jgi:hypothetical protein
MNEVMCLAEDMDIPMFYQDTDSIHMYSKDVTPLSDAFRAEHNRELVGSDMGNFHTDFDLGNCKDIHSEKCITLGKKCYIDALVGIDKTTGEVERGYHMRMKGVPNNAILYECEQRGCTPLQLYDHLYKGNAVTFDLLKAPGGKVAFSCKNEKNMTISTNTNFKRRVQFR